MSEISELLLTRHKAQQESCMLDHFCDLELYWGIDNLKTTTLLPVCQRYEPHN